MRELGPTGGDNREALAGSETSQLARFCEDLATEGARHRMRKPANQCELAPLELQPGRNTGLRPASGVEIGWLIVIRDDGAVRMTTDHSLLLRGSPPGYTLFDEFDKGIRVGTMRPHTLKPLQNKTAMLEPRPDVADESPAYGRKPIALKVCLVPMQHKQTPVGPAVAQNEAPVQPNAVLISGNVRAVGNVVVAENQVKPALKVETVQHIKGRPMRAKDVAKPDILPQLIAVADLHVSEAPTIIIGQSSKKEHLIAGKCIAASSISPVTIAEEDKSIIIIKEDLVGAI